jgi:hypothetical protein
VAATYPAKRRKDKDESQVPQERGQPRRNSQQFQHSAHAFKDVSKSPLARLAKEKCGLAHTCEEGYTRSGKPAARYSCIIHNRAIESSRPHTTLALRYHMTVFTCRPGHSRGAGLPLSRHALKSLFPVLLTPLWPGGGSGNRVKLRLSKKSGLREGGLRRLNEYH